MISEFKGDYAWLSNHEPVSIKFGGVYYPSVEHAFMSAKCDDKEWRKYCSDSKNTSGDVKKKSREVKLVDNWSELRFEVMAICLLEKFKQEPFKTKLLETGTQNIQEGNNHGDDIWGIKLDVNPNYGENYLGRMIMDIRNNLWSKQS